MVRRQADHLARLLDDLLDVSRITSGRIELERAAVDLRAAVSFAVETKRSQLDAKQQKLGLALPDGPVTVLGDPVRLQQVLANLVNNASKYTPAEGSIRVAREAERAEAVLRVRDDGADPRTSSTRLRALRPGESHAGATEGGPESAHARHSLVELHGARGERGEREGGAAPSSRCAALAGAPAVAAAACGAEAERPRCVVVVDQIDGREAAAYLERQGPPHPPGRHRPGGHRRAIASSPDVVLVDIGPPDIDGSRGGAPAAKAPRPPRPAGRAHGLRPAAGSHPRGRGRLRRAPREARRPTASHRDARSAHAVTAALSRPTSTFGTRSQARST